MHFGNDSEGKMQCCNLNKRRLIEQIVKEIKTKSLIWIIRKSAYPVELLYHLNTQDVFIKQFQDKYIISLHTCLVNNNYYIVLWLQFYYIIHTHNIISIVFTVLWPHNVPFFLKHIIKLIVWPWLVLIRNYNCYSS